MPKGGKSKTIEEHIQEGTLRNDKHGIILSNSDYDILSDMKKVLYSNFLEVTKELKTIDKKKETDIYKTLNGVMTDQISSFISICKNRVVKENDNDKKDDSKKININEVK